MRSMLVAFASLALTWPAVAAAETEHVTQTVNFAPGGTLRLRSFSGRVTIVAADQPQVVVDAVRRGDRDRLDHIKLDIHTEGSTLVVDANHRDNSWHEWFGRRHVVETDFDIRVPRRTNLDVNVFSAPVEVHAVEGSERIHVFSAHVQLDDVTGAVAVHSFSGGIDIRTRAWQEKQTIDVDTFSGNVALHVPEQARGTVRFNSFSGRLSSDMPLTLQSSSRRSLTAEIGQPSSDGGSLRLKTFSGNVRIAR